MFDFVRQHTKIMQVLLFLLIMPSFVLFGLEGYSRFNEKGEKVAAVAGENITQDQWDQSHRSEVDRLRARMPNVDAKLLDSPEAKYALLERMVRERLLAAAADKLHLQVSNQRLATELQQSEVIRSLRKGDGSLDMERYRQILAAEGMTPEIYEARLRAELSAQQVLAGVMQTGLSSRAAADLALNAFLERRHVQLLALEPQQYLAKVNLSDADVDQYYQSHAKRFEMAEQATVEYVVLDLESVRKTITVAEADLRGYYEQNAAKLGAAEERKASHVLIAVPAQASAADKQKARDKAQQIQVAVSKAPRSFADVARKESQDPGSASQGGDLGFFARGSMTKPFEDAVFAMKRGDISPVVESEFGFHVIVLTDIKVAKTRSFEEMRKELEADVLKQQAKKKFAEYADIFSNLVYEQADSLKPVADKLKLEIRSVAGVSRQGSSAHSVLSQPKFLAALFAVDAIEKKRNTQAVELGANLLVAGRLTQYAPARVPALAEVRDKVRELARATKAAELARKDGEEKLGRLKTDPTAVKPGAEMPLSRVERKGLAPDVVTAILRTDAARLPAWTGIDLGERGYLLARINKVEAGRPENEAASGAARAQYNQSWAAAETQAYYNALKEQFKVSVKVATPTALK